jgi:succinate-semialdehyde dehydrogenase/glutarate-semialdehyde dehydrogenase
MATHITESRDEKATTEDLKAALKDAGLFREQCYINGEWLDADSKVSIPVTNPATGAVLGHVPRMGAAETRRAIEAADAAWPAWRAQTARERGAILRRWFELLMAHQEDLAKLMTAEQGKPLAEFTATRFRTRSGTSASWF